MAVQKFHEGHSRTAIAKTLNTSRRLVNEWIKNYLSGGFDALELKLATGKPSRLSNEQKIQLKEYVIAHAVKEQGGRLMGKNIQKYTKIYKNISKKPSCKLLRQKYLPFNERVRSYLDNFSF